MLELFDIDRLIKGWIWPLHTDALIADIIVTNNLKCEIFFLLIIIVIFIIDLNSLDQFALQVLCSLLHSLIKLIFLHYDLISVKVVHEYWALLVILLLRLLCRAPSLTLSPQHWNWDRDMDGWGSLLAEACPHLACSQYVCRFINRVLLSKGFFLTVILWVEWLST